jgi:hypothetical protein
MDISSHAQNIKSGHGVCTGVISEPIQSCNERHLWEAMIQKVKGVKNYVHGCHDIEYLEKGEDTVWRTMSDSQNKVIMEHITTDTRRNEIRFVQCTLQGVETDIEIVNVLHRNPLRIEYIKRRRSTGEVLPWDMPISTANDEISKTIEVANVVERSFGCALERSYYAF